MCNHFIYVTIRIYFVQCVMHEIYIVDDSKWIFTARHLQLESLPLMLKSFNLVFSLAVVDIVSLMKSLPPLASIFLLGRNFLRPCKLKAVINHRVAGQSFIREPFELSKLSRIIKREFHV